MYKTHKKRELLKAWLQPAVDAYFNFFFIKLKQRFDFAVIASYQITKHATTRC